MTEPTPLRTTLPWWLTFSAMVVVLAIAIIKPLAPHGFTQFFKNAIGLMPSLPLGENRSLKLVEERSIRIDCGLKGVEWSADGSVLVTQCSDKVEVWGSDWRVIKSLPASAWIDSPFRVWGRDPIKVVYTSRQDSSDGSEQTVLKVWDIEKNGLSGVYPIPNAVSLDVDGVGNMLAVGDFPGHSVSLLSQEGLVLKKTLALPAAPCSIRWIPRTRTILFGAFDGTLYKVDSQDGQVVELSKPYSRTFSLGSLAEGCVGGLALAPSSDAVAIFKIGGSFSPSSSAGYRFDWRDAEEWERNVGGGVEIRSLKDGVMISRMVGKIGPRDLVWDPLDRFIAVSGNDALYLWNWHDGHQVLLPFHPLVVTHALAIRRDGAYLALANSDRVRLFRIENRPN